VAEPLTGAGPDYLEQLLQAAISVPAAAGDAASGRIAGSFLLALAAQGEDARIEPYLAPGGDPTIAYEVQRYDAEHRILSRDSYAGAGEAIRATRASAGEHGSTVQVIAKPAGAPGRWVFMMRGDVAIYRLPAAGAEGFGEFVPPELEAPLLESVGPSVTLVQRLESLPTTNEIVDALLSVLAGLTVQVDVTAIREVVREAVAELRGDEGETMTPERPEGFAAPFLDAAAADALAAEQNTDGLHAFGGPPPPAPTATPLPRIARAHPRVER